jgi:hypothetical protein
LYTISGKSYLKEVMPWYYKTFCHYETENQ